ncbi:FitA-like ribbon-helix-helix domain-containing protein [Ornithinimicrobium sp. W1679]|uniref:FitA-like ribbon-helix-helix domain-containing protein n=1 Tax=Ornithinimicrobium sp. W1679 TaxID=3418770 RepID=UPI003CF63483
MGMLQVKNLPAELHAALADRARAQGVTMSEYVTRLLRRDLSGPTVAEWVAEQRARRGPVRPIDVVGALDEVRVEYDHDERRLQVTAPTSSA